MANKAIKYRLYPTPEQSVLFAKTFGCCRLVYNKMFDVQQERHKNGEKHLSKIDANNYCNKTLKAEYPFLREVDKFALTNTIYNLENGYTRFFKHLGGFPKYKSKHKSKSSYTTNYTNKNIEIKDGYLKLPKLGRIKAKIHKSPSDGWNLNSVTVSQEKDGSFYASVLFEYKAEIAAVPISGNAIGLDYASDGLYVDDAGNVGSNHKYYRESYDKLAKAQHVLSKKIEMNIAGYKIEGNKRYPIYKRPLDECKNIQKQKRIVAKIQRHIANQRKDNLHKLSTEIANRYDVVCVENLNMRAMSNKGFGNGKATMDNGYGMFLTMLEYKLADRGKYFVKVSKWYPSSQLCHCCGERHVEMKDLRKRIFQCSCGLTIGRDQNAAINIRNEGLRLLRKETA